MQQYSRSLLQALYDTGESIKYLFFWGHQPNADGTIGKTCFSQWWESSFTVDGEVYNTAEHWMMAKKAILFEDMAAYKRVLLAKTPAEAKKIGREVNNFDPAIWETHKFELVKQGNIHKFEQHPNLRTFLLQSQNRVLVEASPRDTIWGIGMGASNPEVENPHKWRGENLLGFALMEVRDFFA